MFIAYRVVKPMDGSTLATQWVGIDVSKRTLDVYVRPLGLRFQTANSEAGLVELLSQLEGLCIERVVLEATGGLQSLAVRRLTKAGLPVGGGQSASGTRLCSSDWALSQNRPD